MPLMRPSNNKQSKRSHFAYCLYPRSALSLSLLLPLSSSSTRTWLCLSLSVSLLHACLLPPPPCLISHRSYNRSILSAICDLPSLMKLLRLLVHFMRISWNAKCQKQKQKETKRNTKNQKTKKKKKWITKRRKNEI